MGWGGRFWGRGCPWGPPLAHRGVGAAAHAAAIGLGVFDGVSREVDLQRGRVRVGAVAVGALVGFVLVVLALVGLSHGGDNKVMVVAPTLCPTPLGEFGPPTDLEVGELREGLFAARVWALVGSVARVDSVGTSGHCHLAVTTPPSPCGLWGSQEGGGHRCHVD